MTESTVDVIVSSVNKGRLKVEMWWHIRRNQISCFGKTDDSI